VWTLGPGLIYVLGDYRDNSMDSRQWGPFLVDQQSAWAGAIHLAVD
jgi:hypothetical protein